jgi:hypothetical protein
MMEKKGKKISRRDEAENDDKKHKEACNSDDNQDCRIF